jgi:AcrR family transcriptional regulator
LKNDFASFINDLWSFIGINPVGERRAMAEAEKTARRRAIVSAAAGLLARWSLTDITMDRIAARTGIAKGTVYLYFRTKETLFLDLFEELHNKWHVGLREQLVSADKPVDAREAARIITASLVAEPLLLRLYTVPLPVLEKDLDSESSAALIRGREQRIDETASVLDERIPAINIEQARDFLRRIGWVVAGLVQAASPSPATAQARDRQDLTASRIDFSTELESILTALLQAVDTST